MADGERCGDDFRAEAGEGLCLRRSRVAGQRAHAVLSAAQQGGGDAAPLFAGSASDGDEGFHGVLRCGYDGQYRRASAGEQELSF